MPVVQFTVYADKNFIKANCVPTNYQVTDDDCKFTYYAKCKDYKSYVRNIRCIWNKEKKQLHENGDLQINIYGIIGGIFGEVLIIEHEERVETSYNSDGEYIEETYGDKELLTRLINLDPNCINVNKLTFCKKSYNKEYRQRIKMTPKEKLRSIGVNV